MRVRDVVLVAVVGALGCNKTTTGVQPGVSSSCTVTLSGAVSGTYDCRPATTTWSNTDDTGGFTFGIRASGTTPAMGLAIVWLGEPTDSTYAGTDAGAQADIFVTTASNQTWRASIGGGTAAAGSYSVTFTSVTYNLPEAGGKGYSADGTLNATLPAVAASGATGVVILTASF